MPFARTPLSRNSPGTRHGTGPVILVHGAKLATSKGDDDAPAILVHGAKLATSKGDDDAPANLVHGAKLAGHRAWHRPSDPCPWRETRDEQRYTGGPANLLLADGGAAASYRLAPSASFPIDLIAQTFSLILYFLADLRSSDPENEQCNGTWDKPNVQCTLSHVL